MIRPSLLQPGDAVGIVAPARRVQREDLEIALGTLASWGLVVQLAPNLLSGGHSYLAGPDDARRQDLQFMLDDPAIKAIFCARGGYGTTRILDDIDFSGFLKHPKWIVGFSDITALLLQVERLGVESIHGTMPLLFQQHHAAASIESLRKLLFEGKQLLEAPFDAHNRQGEVTAPVIGGNLSLLVDALATAHEPDTAGKILVLEEIDEYLYKVDRMMTQLKRSGKLRDLRGLVLGHFTDIKDTSLPFGETVEQIVMHHVGPHQYPVAFQFPTGHENPNLAWRHGGMATLRVDGTGSYLQ